MSVLVSLQEVKDLNQVTSSDFDSIITTMIPIVSDFIVKYCAITDLSSGYPRGLKLPASQMIKHQIDKPTDVISETIGNYSITKAENYPRYILSQLNAFRKVKYF